MVDVVSASYRIGSLDDNIGVCGVCVADVIVLIMILCIFVDHMTCSSCSHEWYWTTGADYH